jgi:cell division protein ZapA
VSTKKHTARVTILNEEYAIRTDASPEHAKAVAQYLDQAIRHVMSAGSVVESQRAVVLAALQVTAELLDVRAALEETTQSIESMSEYVRPLLPPAKRQAGTSQH